MSSFCVKAIQPLDNTGDEESALVTLKIAVEAVFCSVVAPCLSPPDALLDFGFAESAELLSALVVTQSSRKSWLEKRRR